MGLATSQVRLLALTSRKADVEMQIQLNSKRKTMLTREATELSKLYYAKLQNARIQYATADGYKDLTYDYIMAGTSASFFDTVIEGDASDNVKGLPSMVLTDTYGRVILNDMMLSIVLDVLNDPPARDANNKPVESRTVESMTIDAMQKLLVAYTKEAGGSSEKASTLLEEFNPIYNGTALTSATLDETAAALAGKEILGVLLKRGYDSGGIAYAKKDGNGVYEFYSNASRTEDCKITLESGKFYIVKDGSTDLTDANGSMYWPGAATANNHGFVRGLDGGNARRIANMMRYYGSIFSAAFNGTTQGISHYNGTAIVEFDPNLGDKGLYVAKSNGVYNSTMDVEKLQDGLKSGLYQIVNVTSPSMGGIVKNQSLEYFKTQNLLVEKTDNSERETITAWYNAARADLEEKETYWDTEITALSTELSTITTEIESVKKLREDAISSTFKWGNA